MLLPFLFRYYTNPYYCRFSLSYRDVSEILKERGVSIHPTTIMRWVHEYSNLIYQIWKKKQISTSCLAFG
ncbi:hypothetical protein BTI247_62420 (plasmid) [Bacillus thuringiensis Bt18247]|uniref:Transposase n=1 Tax=Bacillus thuringiensis Bt18247 TaxID=1423143 RepID=A0A9W3XC94_BACTU|nr:hypothetical protein BTI247_62420 [Bacillus thuringiensis Bt18247]